MSPKVIIIVGLFLIANASGTPIVRIVNGTDAQEGEFPYIVSVRIFGEHNCGGSILNEKNILTAAHCVHLLPMENMSVQYGVLEINSSDNVVQVSGYNYHDDYDPYSGAYENDVAIIELAKPIVFGKNIQPVTLPKAFNATPEHSSALLAGWGLPFSGGDLMTHLQKVNIIVYSDDDCERIHKGTGPTNRKYHVCAGIPEGGKGQCNGDSGGPLTVNGVLVGTVSWSVKPCAVKGYPGVFAKVANYVEWINKNMFK
ncbi:serine protease P41 [Tribolium castaneum]|uniref:Serine protease P41 n=2 Tax=Tribolium castaneum TaxID=7070 RepID=D6WIP2_TRICA|nr:serine protease P41 [Tribolium castaneum]